MSRIVVVVVALLLAALLLPSEATARLLTGASSAEVARGVTILRVLLAANAIVLVAAARSAPKTGVFEPLLARGLRESRAASTATKLALAGLLVVALVLRLHALGQGLSFDEIDTLVHYARLPLGEIATTFDSQNQHLLYSLCARPALLLFDNEAFAVRLPAVVFGVASIWALFRFARRVTGDGEALAAAALLTFSYHHVWFSQNARGYTGLLCFTLLGSASFLGLLGERQPRGLARPLGYGLAMALGAMTHATAVITVVAHFLIWLVLVARGRNLGANRWQPLLGFVFATSLTLLLYALVLPQFLDTLLAPTLPGKATEWKDPAWLLREAIAGIARGVPGGLPVVLLGAAVAALGAWSYARQSASVLATFLLGAALMAGALIATRHNLWPRMFFFAAGFCVLIALRGVSAVVELLARGSWRERAPLATAIALGLVALASVATLRHVWAPKQDYQGALAFVDAERRPEDAVVTVGMTVMPYAELYGKNWHAVDNEADLAAIEELHPRTWIVFTTPTHMQAAFPDVWKRVRERYREARVFWGTLAGCEIVVAVRERAG